LLAKHEIPATVKVSQEVVHNMKQTEGEHNNTLVCKQDLPLSMKDKAEAFNKDVKDITEGINGVVVSVACTVSAGSPY